MHHLTTRMGEMRRWELWLLCEHHGMLTQTKMDSVSLGHIILRAYYGICGLSLTEMLLCNYAFFVSLPTRL